MWWNKDDKLDVPFFFFLLFWISNLFVGWPPDGSMTCFSITLEGVCCQATSCLKASADCMPVLKLIKTWRKRVLVFFDEWKKNLLWQGKSKCIISFHTYRNWGSNAHKKWMLVTWLAKIIENMIRLVLT